MHIGMLTQGTVDSWQSYWYRDARFKSSQRQFSKQQFSDNCLEKASMRKKLDKVNWGRYDSVPPSTKVFRDLFIGNRCALLAS